MAAAPEQVGRELLQCAFGPRIRSKEKKSDNPTTSKGESAFKRGKPNPRRNPFQKIREGVDPQEMIEKSKGDLQLLAEGCSWEFMLKIFERQALFNETMKDNWAKDSGKMQDLKPKFRKSTREIIAKSTPTMQQSMRPFVEKYVHSIDNAVQAEFEEIVYKNDIMRLEDVLYPANTVFAPLVFFVLTPVQYSQDEGMFGFENPSFFIDDMEMKLDIRFMTQLTNELRGCVYSEPFQENDLLKIWWKKEKPLWGIPGWQLNGHLSATLEGERFPNAVGSFGFGVEEKESEWSLKEQELKWWSIDNAFSHPMDKVYVKSLDPTIDSFELFKSFFSLRANAPLTRQEAHNLSWFSYSVLNAQREKIMLYKDDQNALITALRNVFTVPIIDGEVSGYYPHSYVDYPIPNTAYGLLPCIIDAKERVFSSHYQNCLGGLQSLFPTVFSCNWIYDNVRHFSQCHALKGRNIFCKKQSPETEEAQFFS